MTLKPRAEEQSESEGKPALCFAFRRGLRACPAIAVVSFVFRRPRTLKL